MKMNKDFFNKNKVPAYSAANLFCFSTDMLDSDAFEQFESEAIEKGVPLIDRSEELQCISELSSSEEIVNYMRKLKSIANAPQIISKALVYEDETMPLILKRYLTNAVDIFIETAGKCFVKADINYVHRLRKQYNNIRNPYAKAVACLVFGIKEMYEESDFLFQEYVKMRTEYPNESFSDFPLLALHILHDKS